MEINTKTFYPIRHEGEVTAEEAAGLVAMISGALSSSDEEEIMSATNGLLTIQNFIATAGDEINTLTAALSDANARVMALQKSNNECMRQLNAQKMAIEDVGEKVTEAVEFAKHFSY